MTSFGEVLGNTPRCPRSSPRGPNRVHNLPGTQLSWKDTGSIRTHPTTRTALQERQREERRLGRGASTTPAASDGRGEAWGLPLLKSTQDTSPPPRGARRALTPAQGLRTQIHPVSFPESQTNQSIGGQRRYKGAHHAGGGGFLWGGSLGTEAGRKTTFVVLKLELTQGRSPLWGHRPAHPRPALTWGNPEAESPPHKDMSGLGAWEKNPAAAEVPGCRLLKCTVSRSGGGEAASLRSTSGHS